MKLQMGEIYEINYGILLPKSLNHLSPISNVKKKILYFDDFEVFSEGIFPDEKEWVLNKTMPSTYTATRSSMKVYEEKATKIGFEPLPEKVIDILKPHLLLRIGRLKNISWNSEVFESFDRFSKFIDENTSEVWRNQIIDTDRIYLDPFAVKNKNYNEELIEAHNGKYFSVKEILWKANEVQAERSNFKTDGIGIFRSNFKKKIPVYYIGEYYDEALILKEYEDEGIDTNV